MARTGLDYLVFSPITAENSNAAPTYGQGFVIGRAVRAAITENRYDAKLYGDDHIAEAYNGVRDCNVEIETTEITEATMVKLGLRKAVTSGQQTVYRMTDEPTPYGGLGYAEPLMRFGVMKYRATWLYKVQLGMGGWEAQTKGENLTYGTESMTGTALPLPVDATGANSCLDQAVFDTLAEAETWLNNLAGI